MSNKFVKDAESILENAPSPDADASTIKEINEENFEKPAKKRGRPKGAKVSKKKNNEELDAKCLYTAKVINTAIFASTCAIVSTEKAWPSEKRAKELDLALKDYLILKDVNAPPELILLAAYGTYFAETLRVEEVKQNVSEKISGLTLKTLFEKLKFWKGKNKNAPLNS